MKNFLLLFIAAMGLLGLLTQTVSANWVEVNGSALGAGASISAFAINDTTFFAANLTGYRGVLKSTNNGGNWTVVGLKNSLINCFAVHSGNIFAGATYRPALSDSCYGGIFLSTNNGITWQASGLYGVDVLSLAASSSAIFAGADSLGPGHSGGVFLSSNNGASWTAVNSGLPINSVSCLAVSGNDIFAGLQYSIDITLGHYVFWGIYLSTNNGASWSAVNSGLTGNSLKVTSLAVNGSNIFAGTGGGIFLSTNNGSTWNAVNSGLTTNGTNICFAVNGNTIFAGVYGSGVYRSTNNGSTWKAVNSGLTDSNVQSLAVYGGYLYAGTIDIGIWRRPLSELNVLKSPQISLGQSLFNVLSPCLANTNATIEFSLPHSDKVTITIYNLSGHKIASLVNGYLSQGTHGIQWNTRNLATGCYMVKLRAGANTYSKSVPIFH